MKSLGYISLILLGSLYILTSIFGYLKATNTLKWQTTQGKCISVTVTKKFFQLGSRKRRSIGKGFTFVADISYDYVVDDRSYTSDSYSINFLGLSGGLTGSRYYLEDVVNVKRKYAPGATVTVFYDPDQPSNSVLSPGFKGGYNHFVLLLLSALAIGYGVYKLVDD